MSLIKRPEPPTTLEQAHKVIDELWTMIEAQQAQIDALSATVEDLRSRIRGSSRNSSRPPSSDSPEQRDKRPRKPRSSRQQGAQPGHPRHQRRVLPVTEVDQIEKYYPAAHCHCGGTRTPEREPAYRHQVFDLPEVRFSVTEHQIYAAHCDCCGQRTVASTPDSVPAGQMGPGLIAWIVLLAGQFHLSTRQIQRFLLEQWQLGFSLGAISQAQGKANPWLGVLYRQIGAQVRQSAVAHADETRHFRGREQRWLWTLCTPGLNYFMVHYSRGKAAAGHLLGHFGGYLVTDHFAGYNDYDRARRQLCWAHLIRHFRRIAERPGRAGEIGARLLLLAQVVIRTHHRRRDQPQQEDRWQRRLQRLRRRVRASLERGAQLTSGGRTANQCRHLLRDEALCWTFLKDPAIPLTNNTAERAIRPYVIWRKLSYATQSARGDQFRPMVLSVISSAQNLGISTAALLRQLCTEGITQRDITLRMPLDNALPEALKTA